jgi:hypothetical protein
MIKDTLGNLIYYANEHLDNFNKTKNVVSLMKAIASYSEYKKRGGKQRPQKLEKVWGGKI